MGRLLSGRQGRGCRRLREGGRGWGTARRHGGARLQGWGEPGKDPTQETLSPMMLGRPAGNKATARDPWADAAGPTETGRPDPQHGEGPGRERRMYKMPVSQASALLTGSTRPFVPHSLAGPSDRSSACRTGWDRCPGGR